jgi:hypothetical protein
LGWLREIFSKRGSAKKRDAETPRVGEGDIKNYHLARQWLENLEGRQYLSNSGAQLGSLYFDGTSGDDTAIAAIISAGTGTYTYTGSIQNSADTQQINGTFALTANSTHDVTISTSTASITVPGGLASFSNGTSSTLDANDSTGLSGSISGDISVDNFSLVSLTVNSVTWNPANGSNPNITVNTTGSLTISNGETISGTFGVGDSGTSVSISVGGGSINLESGAVTATGITGSMTVTSSGITGSGSGSAEVFTSSGIQFSGSFGFSVDTTASDPNLKVTATAATLTIGNSVFTTDVELELQTSAGQTYLAVLFSNTSMNISVGGNTVLSFASGASQAAFLFQNGGVVGALAGTVTVTPPNTGGASDSVQALVEINTMPLTTTTGTPPNTSTNSNNFEYPDPFYTGTAPYDNQNVTILADSGLQVFARGLTVPLTSTQNISGDFYFAATATTVTFSAANVTATVGDVSLTNGTGNLTIDSGGITGSLSGDVTFASGTISTSGSFGLSISEGAVTVVGNNVTINVDGEQFTGSFSIDAESTTTTFTITDASLLFGGGLFQIDDLTGSFTLGSGGNSSSGLSGDFNATVGGATFTGAVGITVAASAITLSGTSDTLTIGDETVSGNFTASDNAGTITVGGSNINASLGGGLVTVGPGASMSLTVTTGDVTGSFSGAVSAGAGEEVSFSGDVTVNVDSSAGITASGTGDTFTVNGQSFNADFGFSEDSLGLELSVSNIAFNLDNNALEVTNAHGDLLVATDPATTKTSVSGSFGATFSSDIGNFTGTLEVAYTPDGTFTINATGVVFDDGVGDTVSGDMAITVSGGDLDLAATNLSASLGNGLVTIGPPSGGSASSTLEITGTSGNHSFSGSFSGVVSVGSATGVGFSGPISVSVTGTDITASGTGDTLTIGGQAISANFDFSESAGNLMLDVSGVSFSIGSLISVTGATGDLVVSSTGVTGSASGSVTQSIAGFTGDLAVGFAPGVIMISGTNDTITFGTNEYISGSFNFTKDTTGLHLSASNFEASFANGLVTILNGSATLNVDTTTGAISGSFSGTLAAGTGAFGLSGSVSVTVGGGAITASGTGDTVTLFGISLTGGFTFSEDASGNLDLAVTGLNFSPAGSAFSITSASGTLQVTTSGISGSTSGNIASTLAGLSGTFGIGFDPVNGLSISGTNDKLAIGGQSISGNFGFTLSGANSTLNITNATVDLGGGFVQVTNGTASVAFTGTTLTSGSFSGNLSLGTATTASFTGSVSGTITPTAITASGTGDTVTIAGQSLSGNFTFAYDSTNKEIDFGLSGVSLSIGSVISVNMITGTVDITAAGVTGNVTGSLVSSAIGLTATTFGVMFSPTSIGVSATGAVLTIAGQTLGGTFDFIKDNTGIHLSSSNMTADFGGGLVTVSNGSADLNVSTAGAVTGSFTATVEVGSNFTASGVGFGGTVSVTVSSTGITASGTNDLLTIAGNQLLTNFTFSKDAGGVSLGVTDLNLSLGNNAITITNASGTLQVTASGITGSASGTVATNLPGITLSGDLAVTFGGGTISVTGTSDTLTAGGQTISGSFNFVSDSTGLHLSASNFMVSLGGGLVTISNGSGELDIVSGAISGSFSGTLAAGTVGGSVSFSGSIAVSVGNGTISAATIPGQDDTLTIGTQPITAAFSFVKNSSGLQLTVSDVSFSVGGVVSISDGGGTLNVASSGISGSVMGTITTSFTGFSFSGTLAVAFAPGTITVSGTNDSLTAGGQSISGDFTFTDDNTGVHLSASNFAANFGNGIVTVSGGSGSLAIVSGAISGSFSGTVAAGSGDSGFSFSGPISVTFGSGSFSASSPNGQTDSLTVLGQTLSAGFDFTENSTGVQLTLSNVNLSFDGGALQVTNAGGTVAVAKTGISGSISGTLTANIPNVTFSGDFSIAFDPTSLDVSGTNVSLTAYGQSISGSFTFSDANNTLSLTIENLALSIGGIVNVTGGTGSFVLTTGASGGMTGSASGNVSITGLGNSIQFGGSYSVSVGNGTTSVSGTGDSLTLFGQTLIGNFSFTKTSTSVDLHINSLNLSLGGGLLQVTGGAADLTVDSTGITGDASGNLGIGSSETGFTISGDVSVVFSPTSLTVEDDNAQVTLSGITLSADKLIFSRDSTTGDLSVGITNISLSLSGQPAPVSFSGSLLVLPAGLSGTMTATVGPGTITVAFGNGTYEISAGISTAFSETLGPVAISGTINASLSTGSSGVAGTLALTDLDINMGNGLLTITGGSASFAYDGHNISGTATGTVMLNGVSGISLSGTVTITFTPTTIAVSGTGMSLTVLGQTLAGDFTFSDNGDGTIHVTVANLTISLANAVSVTNGTADFTIGSSGASAGIVGTGSADVAINLPGVSFNSDLSLSIDTTGGNSTFLISGNPVTLTFAGQSLSGSFTIQKVTTSKGVSTVSLVASGITAFFGDGDTGVQISNGGGAILILPAGLALDVSGAASLVGVTGLTLGGTLHVLYNNTGSDVNESLPAPGNTTTTLTVASGTNTVEGTATLGIGNGSGGTFVSLTGGFYVSDSQTTTGNTQLTTIILAAAGLNAFIGNGATTNSDGSLNTTNAQGVLIQNADLGLILLSSIDNTDPNNPVHSPSTFALTASGGASILGIPGITLSGTLSVQDDTAGAQNTTVQVPDPINPGSTIPVVIDFTANQLPSFAGSINLSVANPSDLSQSFVTFSGDFNFTQPDANTISVAVTDVTAFVGIGGTTPVGLQITGGSLGLLLIKQGSSTNYALDASGNISLVGLPGLYVGGMMTVMSNTTGVSQTNPADGTTTIPAGGPTVSVDNMTFQILDSNGDPVISIGVTASITKMGSDLDINATNVTFTLDINNTQIVELQGMVEFTLGPDGFNLGPSGFALTGFSLLDQPIIAPPAGASPGLSTPALGPVSSPSTTPGSTGAPGAITPVPAAPSGSHYKLGPLTVYGLSPIFKGFSFSGGQLVVTVGLSATAALLSFGSNSGGTNQGGTQAELTDFAGSFQLAVGLDLSSFRITSFGPTGKFSFTAGGFYLDVPNVVNVTAQNIAITYDPKGPSNQQLISIGTATITVPLGSGGNGIQGQISPYTDSSGNTIPGLVVYEDHFVLGTATLKYLGTLSLGSIVSFTNPFISISDLSVSFSGSLDFDGSISFGADSVSIGPSAFQLTGTNVKATLTDNAGDWGFVFTAGSIGLSIGGIVSLTASNVTFDPTATGTETLLSLSSLSVVVSLKAITLTGSAGSSAGDIVIDGAGDVAFPDPFTITVTISSGTSGGLGWPSWIPIQISMISLTWTDIVNHPSDFTLTFSATVSGSIGPIQISGFVDGIQINIGYLLAGQFPITGIQSFGISATGNVFGGTLSAAVVMGIIQLDSFGHQEPPGVDGVSTVMYFGVQGGFTMPELGGLDIRFGMSQNGPLEAYIQLDPGPGILIVPPVGLAIVGLSGGITFDATPFPSISNATDLKNPVFSSGVLLSLPQWEMQLKQETLNQSGAGGGGYLFTVSPSNSSGYGQDPSGDATALSAGNVATDLSNAFANNGDQLSNTPTVVTEGSSEWLIKDGSNYYLVTKDTSNNLEISQYRFVVDTANTGANGTVAPISQLVSDLNSGQVTSNIIAAFQAYGITLPATGATISTVAPQPGQSVNSWVITVGGFKYSVTQDTAGLLEVESSGGSMSALNGVIRIEASVSLGLEGVPSTEFSATGDIIIETDGKILLSVNATFGGTDTIAFKLYIDLSQVTSGQVTILFYFEQDVVDPLDSTMKFPELVIAGGVQMGETDAAGNFVAAGDPTATGFGFKLTGLIAYSYVPGVTLTFTGGATIIFASTQMSIVFNASLSANIENFIQVNNIVTAAGSFTIQYSGTFEIWGAAEIQFTGGAIPFLATVGIQANATIFLRINTDSIAHTINFDAPTPGGTGFTPETFTLQPYSFGLYLVGRLTLQKGPIDFVLDGVFDIDFMYDQSSGTFSFNMFAFAELSLGIAGQNLFTFDAIGLLVINNDGFAAMFALDATVNTPVLAFDFHFALFVNTTGVQVSYTLPADLVSILNQDSGSTGASGVPGSLDSSGLLSDIYTVLNDLSVEFSGANLVNVSSGTFTINIPAGAPQLAGSGVVTEEPAGPYLLVEGAGNITLLPGLLGSDAPTIQGMAEFEASANGLTLFVEGSLILGPLTIAASGDIQVVLTNGDWGLVAAISLAATINISSAVELGGAATLEINTTGVDQDVKEFQYDASTNSVSNTPVDTTIPGTVSLRLHVEGQLSLGSGAIALNGAFLLTINTSGTGPLIEFAATASLSFFGINLDINANLAAGIYSNGDFAFEVQVTVSFNIADLISFSGQITLSMNTSLSPITLADTNGDPAYTITPGFAFTFHLSLNILFGMLSFEVYGAISYNAITHVFLLEFLGSETINLFIFDETMTIAGWVDSTGEFAAAIYGDFSLGISGVVSLDGDGYFQIAYGVPDSNGLFNSYFYADNSSLTGADLPQLAGDGDTNLNSLSLRDMPVFPTSPKFGTKSLYIGGSATLTGELFGFDIGSVTVGFQYASGQLTIHVGIHLNFFFFSITISFTLTIGSVSAPPQVYLAGTPTANQVSPGSFGGGALVLNVGNRAGYRNYDNSDTNEDIAVTGSNYNSATGTETLYVTYTPPSGSGDGQYTEVFQNVTSLSIPGDGANTVTIANSVAVPVYITAGATGEAATIYDAGTGGGSITGGPADDLIESGEGKTTINGGGGADTIIVGAGGASINTASGAGAGGSRVLWSPDSATGSTTWTGTTGDILYINSNDPTVQAYANGETITMGAIGTNITQITAGTGKSMTVTSVPNVVLSAAGGGNNITVNNMVGGGVNSLQISYGATHTSGNVLSVAGSTGADTYTINSSTDTLPAIPSATNLSPTSGISVATVNIDRTGGLQIEVFGISHTAGDTLAVNSKGGNDSFYVESLALPTTITGNDANASASTPYTTTYYVGWVGVSTPGSLSLITALLTIDGTAGTDVLQMFDNADLFNRTFNLTNTQLISDALGTNGRLVYNNEIDVFDLFAGPGQNNYVVTGTGAVGQTHIIAGDTNMTIDAGSITTPTSVDGGANLGQNYDGDPLVVGNVLFVNGTTGNDTFVIAPGEIDVTADGGSLTVPIYYTNFQSVVIEGQGGNDTFTVNGNNLNLLINDPLYNGSGDYASPSYAQVTGADTFIINGNSAAMTLFGGSTGTNNFTIAGNGGTIDINDPTRVDADQGNGSANFTVNGNSSNLTIGGLAGTNTFNINANTGTLALTGGSGLAASNTFNILGNFGVLTESASGGSNIYNIAGISAPITLETGDFPASYTVTAPLHAAVSITAFPTTRTSIATLVSELNAHTLTTDLIDTFEAYGNILGVSTTISGTAPSWTITDGSDTYAVVEDANGVLTVSKNGFGALLFTDATAADATALDSGTVSSNLAGLFVTNSVTLSASPSVITESAGNEWLILDGSNYYLVVNVAGTLNISKYNFVIDSVGSGYKAVTQTLNVNGTSGDENFALSTTSVSGVGSAINYTGLMAVSINGNGGHDSFTVTGNTGATTITTGIGTSTINVSTISAPLTINSQLGVNTITLGNLLSNLAGAIVINGSGGDSLTLSDTSDGTGINGTLTSTTFSATSSTFGGLTYSGLSQLTINLGSGADTLLITSTLATTPVTISTGNGTDTVNVQNISSAVSITTGTGTDTINVGSLAPTLTGGNLSLIQGALTIHGGGHTTLVLDDDADTIAGAATLTSTTFTGLAMAAAGITYSGLSNFDLALGNKGNVLTVASTSAATSYQFTGGTGGDTFNIQSTNATGPVAITTGTGTNIVNIASATNTLAGILGQISVTGTGTDTLNLNDSGSSASRTINITSAQINITGLAAVLYTTIDTLSITLGSGTITGTITSTATGTNTTLTTGSANNTITINGTSTANTTVITGTGNDTVYVNAIGGPTTVNVGTGTNSVTVGAASHLISGIAANLTLNGAGTDTITIDDSTDVSGDATLSATAYDNINFAGDTTLAFLNIDDANTSQGAGTLTITGTPATALTTITDGPATIDLNDDNGPTTINLTTTTLVSIDAEHGLTTINSLSGSSNYLLQASPETLVGIQGHLVINDNGNGILDIYDNGATTSVTGTLTSTTLTGLGMGTAGITYSDLYDMSLHLGSGGTTLTVTSTGAISQTDIDATSGNDIITLASDSSQTDINAGTGTTTTNIQTTSAQTIVTTAAGGHNTINIGNNGSVDGINGEIDITGSGADILTVDDSASTIGKGDILLNAILLKNLSPGDINYSGLASLTIKLGTASDTVTIYNTGATTVLDLGTADDTVTIDNDSNNTTINTSDPTNVINILGTSAPTAVNAMAGSVDTVNIGNAGSVQAVLDPITITGNDDTIVNVDDSADTTGRTASLSAAVLTGIAPAAINYSSLATLSVTFGSGDDNLTISNTAASTTTNINTAAGDDTVTVQGDTGPTNINVGIGTNTVNIQAAAGTTAITTPGGGVTTTTLGNSGNVDGITGALTITGAGNDTLIVDDSANANTKYVSMTSTTLVGITPHTITYTGVSTLTVNLGTGGNFLVVYSTPVNTATTFNMGSGNDYVTIGATTGPLTVNTQGGNNAIDIGGLFGSTLASIAGTVSLTGDGFDVLTIDETFQANADTGVVTPTAITGFSPATINYAGIKTLIMTLGSSTNVINVTGTSSASTVSAGNGHDNIDVSTIAPNAGGTLGDINGVLSVLGNGSDNLLLDNSGDTTGETVTLSDGQETGASPAAINYSGLGTLTVLLGTGDDNLTITTTITGTSNINAGNGDNTVTVDNTQGPLNLTTGTGDDTLAFVAISSTTDVNTGDGNDSVHLETVNGPTTLVMGSGNDTVQADTINAATSITTGGGTDGAQFTTINAPTTLAMGNGNDTVLVTTANAATSVTLGDGTDSVQLDTINAATSVTAGNGSDTVNLQTATAPTHITTGTGVDVVNITSTAPTAGGTLNNITAVVTVTAGGKTTLNLDDTGSTSPKSMILLGTSVSGLSAGDIDYSGLSNLNIKLGSGVETVTVHSTQAGADSVITAGSANDTFTLSGTSTTSLAAGLAGPITVDGALGTNALSVDDSTDTAVEHVVLTPTTITGIGSTITYLNFATLGMLLGTASDLTVNGTNPGTGTTVGGGGSGGFPANINYPGDFTGTLVLTDVNGGTINIVGSLAGAMSITGSLDALDIGIDLSGTFALTGNLGTLDVGGNLSGSASIGGNLGTLDVGGDVSGQATIGGNLSTIDIGGDLSGLTSVGGNLGGGTIGNLSGRLLVGGTIGDLTINNNLSGTLTAGGDVTDLDVVGNLSGVFSSGGTVGELTVGGNLSGRVAITDDLTASTIGILSGTLDIGGALGALTILGADSGTLTAASVGTISLPDATVTGAGNILFSLTQDGIYRAIRAIPGNGSDLSGLSANIFYEGSTSPSPEAAVRLTNSNPGQSFDLVLVSDGVSNFNLERVDSNSGAKTGLFNLDVNGSLITPDAATTSYFGYVSGAPTVDLPADHLGLVSVSQNLPSDSILASSIQGVAFATLGLPNGNHMLAMAFFTQTNLLFNVLAINPATKKPYAQVVAPGNQMLRVMVSPASSTPVGVFTGRAKKGTTFASNALYFSDQNSDPSGTLMADVTFSAGARSHGRKVVTNITFEGDGGAVNTWSVVNNITSDGWLGDVLLEGGYAKLQSLTAPAIHGNINLFGGKLVGQIQTTDEEIDPITGATTAVDGDLGAVVDGSATTLHVAMQSGSSIVVRGNLLSHVVVDNSVAGDIFASGNIGSISGGTRLGGISVLSSAKNSGKIISQGDIDGDIIMPGNLSGRIAAKGNIMSKVSIGGQMMKGSAVIAGGEIGDTTLGTRLSTEYQQGLIVAGTMATTSSSKGSSKYAVLISNADSSSGNAAQLANIWTDGGVALAIDTPGTLDEAGLKLMQHDVANLSASNGNLSGTTA